MVELCMSRVREWGCMYFNAPRRQFNGSQISSCHDRSSLTLLPLAPRAPLPPRAATDELSQHFSEAVAKSQRDEQEQGEF